MSRAFLAPCFLESVEDRISFFTDLPGDLHVAKAVGNLLGNATRLANCFCQVAGMKGSRQFLWDQFSQVSCCSKTLNTFDFQESLILDLEVVVPMTPAASMAGES